MPESFAFVLGHYVQRSHYSVGRVAALSSLPKRTIANWLGGIVLKPQQWQGIIKVAVALKLSEAEASQLLTAAGHPPLTELRQLATGADRDLLLPWPQPKNAPFQAIADLPYFVGREQALHMVGDVLLQGQHVAICNLHGMGGVGKTSLAARLAYQLRPFFPDGILWARLDTSDTLSILRAFAAAYGEDVSSYHDLDSCASAVRSILADKQALIVLDNVEKSEQVRPLLPPTTGKTAVLITTRHDLAVADGMYRFSVETFDPASGESLALFVSFLGQDAVQEWRETLQSIADLLGHLPLAVAIAAGRLANGRVPIPSFLEQLQQAEQRLDVLIREDRNVRLSFDLSYHALPSDLQQFFAALGAFGGDDFGVTAVAYITQTSEDQAQAMLDKLCQLSLVHPAQTKRYSLHPLLRDYARTHIASNDIYIRMANFYVEFAESQSNIDFDSFAVERSNILASLNISLERRLHHCLLRNIKAFNPYLRAQGLLKLQQFYLEQALQFAYILEEEESLIELLFEQGWIEFQRGHFSLAETFLLNALNLVNNRSETELKNQQLRCDILIGLGVSHAGKGDLTKAYDFYYEAQQIAEATEHLQALTKIKLNLGGLTKASGDYAKGISHYLESLSLARRLNFTPMIILSLMNLCELMYAQGNLEEAEAYLDEAESLTRTKGHSMRLFTILMHRSVIARKKGDAIQSELYLTEGIELARKVGHPDHLMQLLTALGNQICQKKDYHRARQYLQEALSIARQSEAPYKLCEVLYHWGELHFSEGKWNEAAKIWVEVLEKSLELNFPKHIIGAYHSLARTARAQKNDLLSRQYNQNWQSIYNQMNTYEKTSIKHWLPELPV